MRKRILLVARDTSLCRVLCDNLAFDGFEVVSAADGPAALEAVRSFAPDLVVLDVERGDAGPGSLLASLRQHHSTPVLLLSTQGRHPALAPSVPERGGEPAPLDGASELLPKPFDLDDLLERVRALLALPASTV